MRARWYVWKGSSGVWYADVSVDGAIVNSAWRCFRTWREAYDFADRVSRA